MSEELLNGQENANNLDKNGAVSASPAEKTGAGDPSADLKTFKPDGREESYVELERKLTQIGQENSELKRFYEDVLPALETIEKDPEIKEAILKKMYPDQYQKASEAAPASPIVNNQPTPPAPDISRVKDEILKSVEDKTNAFKEQLDYERGVDEYVKVNNIDNDMLTRIRKIVDEKNIDDIEVAHKYVLAEDLIKEKESRPQELSGTAGPSVGSQGELPKGPSIDDYVKNPFNPNSYL